jgi:hypothetical protein
MTRTNLKHFTKSSGDEDTGMYYWNGSYWQHPIRAIADFNGTLRMVRLNQQADTFFSWPGRTSYGRFTLRCYVTTNDDGRLIGHYERAALEEKRLPDPESMDSPTE